MSASQQQLSQCSVPTLERWSLVCFNSARNRLDGAWVQCRVSHEAPRISDVKRQLLTSYRDGDHVTIKMRSHVYVAAKNVRSDVVVRW